jgi:hypothetical protein
MPNYVRKCENWLETFGRWTLPRCESPETFVFWSGLFILSSALRRQVKVGKKYLGSWECPPHLYIMFIGEAGVVRKTTAANFGSELLDEINFIKRGPTIVTQAALLTKLVESPDASVYVLSEEFSDVIMKSGEDMFAFLTAMFDGKKSIESSTIMRGTEFAVRPCINMLAATTPQWVAAKMPEQIIGGGFASRVIFIQEDTVRERHMYYKAVMAKTDFNKLKLDLVADLRHIAETVAGDFELDEEAEKFMEAWYQEHADDGRDNYKLSGYYQRRPAHIHKVAMLMHIAKSDELILHKHDFENAISLVLMLEKNLPKVFEGVGKNPYTIDISRIRNHIIAKEPIADKDLRTTFASTAEPWKLDQFIKSLVAIGEVKVYKNGTGELYYTSPGYVLPAPTSRKPFDPNDIETWNN